VVCYGGSGKIRALGANDGRTRWTADADAKRGLAGGGDLVVAVSEAALTGLDAVGGRTRWTYPLEIALAPPLVGGGLVYAADSQGGLRAVRADTGTVAWAKPDFGSALAAGDAAAVAYDGNGILYASSGRGQVFALRAGTGDVLWSRSLDHDGVLGLAGDTVCAAVGAASTLYGLDAATGRVRWTYPADMNRRYGPVAAAGLVFIGTRDGNVAALAPQAGQRAGS
jgi:outer membrane protein assembly factor BamB